VMLPFDEKGVVVNYITKIWGNPFMIKITKGVVFNEIGDIVDFNRNDIIFKNKKLDKLFKKIKLNG